MLSHLEYLKYLPGLACLVGLCWLLFSGNRRLFSMRRQLPLLSLCAALLTVGALLSTFYLQVTPAHAISTDCLNNNSAAACNGNSPAPAGDPDACWLHNASIVNSVLINDSTQPAATPVGTLRIWYSSDCQTNWVQFIGGYDTTGKDLNSGSSSLDGWASGTYGKALGGGSCGYLYNASQLALFMDYTEVSIRDSNHTTVPANAGVQTSLQVGPTCTAVSPMVYATASTPVTAQLAIVAISVGKPSWHFSTTVAQDANNVSKAVVSNA